MSLIKKTITKKVVPAGLLLIFLVSGVRYSLLPVRTFIHSDNLLALPVRESVAKKLTSQSVYSKNARSLLNELQEIIPCVSGVQVRYSSALSARICVESYKPLVLLGSKNDGPSHVLCKTELQRPICIVEKNLFDEQSIKNLSAITIENTDFKKTIEDKNFALCFLRLPNDTLADYYISWRSATEIILHHRSLPVVIITDSNSIHDKNKFTAVHRIFARDASQFNERLKADIRLDDSIICSAW